MWCGEFSNWELLFYMKLQQPPEDPTKLLGASLSASTPSAKLSTTKAKNAEVLSNAGAPQNVGRQLK